MEGRVKALSKRKEEEKAFFLGGGGRVVVKRELPTGSWPLTSNYSIWNYLPISISCGVKRYMRYIIFLLSKSCQSKACLGLFLFTFLIFYESANIRMITEWAFTFLNTAVIIFCLIYLNIPHSIQSSSFFHA